jgi:phosphatidylserine/phosphatidylglycerophosphate/cardiolipin synthase-like enzyme
MGSERVSSHGAARRPSIARTDLINLTKGTNRASYPISLREESISASLPTTMAEGAKRGRCWRSGHEEANLNVLDEKFVAAHTRVFEEDKSHCREITLDDWRRRPWGEKIRGRIGSLLASQM